MANPIRCGRSFSQATFDTLRIPQVDYNYRYPKYHNFSNRSIFADMLESLTGFRNARTH